MDSNQRMAPVKWLLIGSTVLALISGIAESAASETTMLELACRYDMSTGGRMCDCEYRDEVMSENI